MKFLSAIIVLLLLSWNAAAQSFELNSTDTINKIDISKKRQGYWMIKANPKNL